MRWCGWRGCSCGHPPTRSRCRRWRTNLYADTIFVGLEPDRVAAGGDRYVVWNANDFALEACQDSPRMSQDPHYTDVQTRAWKQLRELEIDDPATYALNWIAKAVATAQPLRLVTDDFVVFCWREDMDELLAEDLRASAMPAALAKLRVKGLLP
jgi:hypothetical protein